MLREEDKLITDQWHEQELRIKGASPWSPVSAPVVPFVDFSLKSGRLFSDYIMTTNGLQLGFQRRIKQASKCAGQKADCVSRV